MHYLRLYLRYTAISIRSQMQYRASFLLMLIGQLLVTGTEFLAIWALFARFGSLRGYTLPQIALFYGVMIVGFGLAESFARGFDVFPRMIRAGDFDRLLLRPLSTPFQLAAQELQLMRAGRYVQALAVLGWACGSLGLLSCPSRLVLVGLMTLGCWALFYGLIVLQATLSFWTVDGIELMNSLTFGGTEVGQFPITIYRPWFRELFTFVVPIACVNVIPSRALFGRAALGAPALAGCYAAPLVGFAFLALALRAWRFGERHYCSTGS